MKKIFFSLLLLAQVAFAQPVVTAQVHDWQEAESYGGCSLACATCWDVKASSQLASSGDLSYGPDKTQDVDYGTCWAEGAPGDGIGEFFEFHINTDEADHSASLRGLRIKNGYAKSAELWKKNNRIKEMDLSLNGQVKARIKLLDTMQNQGVNLEAFQVNPGDVIRLTIVSVYPGSAYQDTCISEIVLDGAH